MPKRKGEFHPIEDMHNAQPELREDGGNKLWYKVAGEYVKGYSVIDIGAGNGYGMKIMKNMGAKDVEGIDPAPGGCVRKGRGEDIKKIYDWVVCIEVIEHIIDDIYFFNHLLKIARVGIFLTTPNYNVYGATNWHHYREYTPEELRELLDGLNYDIWNFDPEKCNPPKRVETLDECTNYGIVIWKNN